MPIYLKNNQKSIRLDRRKIRRELNRALLLLGCQTAEVSILFVGDRKMRSLNFRFRQKDKTTDVLSFPMSGGQNAVAGSVLGDIVVSVPRAALQARQYDVPLHDEMLRLLLHGLLHLLGYDHEINEYQKRRMKKKEKELFDAVKAMA
jgi:probable rRNA maturation factor